MSFFWKKFNIFWTNDRISLQTAKLGNTRTIVSMLLVQMKAPATHHCLQNKYCSTLAISTHVHRKIN